MPYTKHKSQMLDILSMPLIWSVLIPFVVLDVWIEVYHRIGFKMYGLPYVERSKYIRIDRHKLSYLNIWEKAGCVYCGYVNGLLHYMTVIAANTEKYWCAIQHKDTPGYVPPQHHKDFAAYGDATDPSHQFYTRAE